MNQIKKIILTGPPGTGKTSIINKLKKLGFICFDEVWNDNYENPSKKNDSDSIIEFSNYLFRKRKDQFEHNLESEKIKEKCVFYDRSLIDVVSYLKTYNKKIPTHWIKYIKEKKYYNNVFYCPLWEDIYVSNKSRKENYEETIIIDDVMRKFYKKLGYKIKELPRKSILNRIEFIFNNL